ncbi:hypothetical protein NA57DRAFT_76588 [Rhizodiscina lignyota]|uniref:Uncharacterized protein n=1 Tax=Rhizodiscina lignyota TaxID=1504668 RepID=A0A9P4M5F7_9PEZI|nr:hypothetical protein NA57DRAFT_76588 [Rhizodiscina lignyota]
MNEILVINAKVDTLDDLYRFGTPSEGRFFYPSEERRTEETTAAMRMAESKLDKFWRYVDKNIRINSKMSFHEFLGISHRTLDRTPPWESKASKPTAFQTMECTKALQSLVLEVEPEKFDKRAAAEGSRKKKKTQKTVYTAPETDDNDPEEARVAPMQHSEPKEKI